MRMRSQRRSQASTTLAEERAIQLTLSLSPSLSSTQPFRPFVSNKGTAPSPTAVSATHRCLNFLRNLRY